MNLVINKKYYIWILCVVNITIFILCAFKKEEKDDEETVNYSIDARHMNMWKKRFSKFPIILSCHESKKGDNLKVLNSSVLLPEDSIFFLETSCMTDWSSRHACAVESAAKTNLNRQVYVLFSSSVSKAMLKESYINALARLYPNVKYARVLIKDLVKGTPLQSYVYKLDKRSLDDRTPRILKFLILYTFGGIYLSFDVVVAKEFDLCDSWFVKDTPSSYSSDMFAFSRSESGKRLADLAVRLIKDSETQVEDHWTFEKTSILTHVVTINLIGKPGHPISCKELGFQVYEPDKFYPFNFHERGRYFSLGDINRRTPKDVYTYHTFYKFTKYKYPSPLSLYGKIAREFCPLTYKHFGDSFGVIKYSAKKYED